MTELHRAVVANAVHSTHPKILDTPSNPSPPSFPRYSRHWTQGVPSVAGDGRRWAVGEPGPKLYNGLPIPRKFPQRTSVPGDVHGRIRGSRPQHD